VPLALLGLLLLLLPLLSLALPPACFVLELLLLELMAPVAAAPPPLTQGHSRRM
jgi:hypothetical protein